MTNRLYRLIYGATLILALYFEQLWVIYGLIALNLFEAISDVRVPRLVSRLRYGKTDDPAEASLGIHFVERCSFEAERGWRLMVATMLAISLFLFPEYLWFLPWFMGFAIFGAGISGVCPMFLALKWIGLR